MSQEQKETPKSAPRAASRKKAAAPEPVEITDDPIIDKIRQEFPHAILEAVESDWQTLLLRREQLFDVCQFLRDDAEAQFDFLTDVAARHTPEAETTFQVIYHLYSFPRNARLRLKVNLNEDEAVPSMVQLWSGANWMEREAYDMVGVRFENHPDLRRLLLPEDWEGHPLRKEYPLEFKYNRWTANHLNMIPFDPEGEYTGKFE